MTEYELLRTALIIPPRARSVLCFWAALPGVVCAPFIFWQSLHAGILFCLLSHFCVSCVPLLRFFYLSILFVLHSPLAIQ